ncbi:polysaccharide biosynthesis C-terminal domain-containing protein [Caloramator sp. mosi_1]|uniref:polysaccharide biosynthesis C-terminal domain-containing protein n=1 Tax=Caloramator sp. mosi_1 TaxID=3023090 RepID=UPI002361BF28|nr:polysaccharide biosynthesis C-terminal domain-containing protein [Caloramator sp. mosi_1]WDC83483.1 polysaccharide biosynthesis C-terminal domain-containing protein [Caloramator sp. mosi_1]
MVNLYNGYSYTFIQFCFKNILNDDRTQLSILCFCPALIIVSISSIFKGVFYGYQKVLEPAIIDVLEKAIRILSIYLLIQVLKGYDINIKSAAAYLALSIGELTSLILLFICFINFKHQNPPTGKSDNSLQLLFNLLKLSIPLALNGILSTMFSSIIAILIPKRLHIAGLPYEESISMLGKLQGMAMNVVFFPAIIISSLSTLLIPSISEEIAFKNYKILNHRINTTIKFAMAVAFASCAILLNSSKEISMFIYKDSSVGNLIYYLSIGLPIVYFEILTFSILNGLGKQFNLLINSIFVSLIDITLIYFLMAIPQINIYGYCINFAISGATGAIINLTCIYKTLKGFNFDFYKNIIIPLLIGVLVYIIGSILVKLLPVQMFILICYLIYASVFILTQKLSFSK